MEEPRMPENEAARPIEYKPSKGEALREYEISIRFLNRGCIVSVGCKSIAFESVEVAMNAINDYVVNPYEKQKEWRKSLD